MRRDADIDRRNDQADKREDRSAAEAAWAAHNLSQLRYFRSLSLRAKLEAVQGMADIVRRFQALRKEGRFVSLSQSESR